MLGCLDEPWRWSGELHEICDIKSPGQLRETHFGIRVGTGEEQAIRIRKARRDDCFESRVKRANESCEGSATRTTRGSEAGGIHFRPAGQIVESTDGVPNKITR